MRFLTSFFATSTIIASAAGKAIPPNLRRFYNNHFNVTCDPLVGGPFASYYGRNSPRDMNYAQDAATSALFLKRDNGGYADMDIDCDGENASEGRCHNDPTGQSITAFQYQVEHYNAGIHDLDAHIHPYVVLGNTGGGTTFKPQSVGIKPLSVVAVVCGNHLHYGIWGDVNGGVVTGEAALAMGQLCFGNTAVSGNSGYEPHDVLYIAFPGKDAVPGANGAKWDAKTKEEFEASIQTLGDRLVAQL